MPAKDKYHDHVRRILEKDGWAITHDPYFIRLGRRKGYIDLGAERSFIGAEKGKEKILVEIKSFLGMSDLDQFEDALGQFLVYRPAVMKKEPERTLYLAIPKEFDQSFFDDDYFVEIAELYEVKMLVFDEDKEEIVSWKK